MTPEEIRVRLVVARGHDLNVLAKEVGLERKTWMKKLGDGISRRLYETEETLRNRMLDTLDQAESDPEQFDRMLTKRRAQERAAQAAKTDHIADQIWRKTCADVLSNAAISALVVDGGLSELLERDDGWTIEKYQQRLQLLRRTVSMTLRDWSRHFGVLAWDLGTEEVSETPVGIVIYQITPISEERRAVARMNMTEAAYRLELARCRAGVVHWCIQESIALLREKGER